MPGLLSDVLPWAYSQGDRAKRLLGGLLSDPAGTAQQAAGNFSDNANQLRGLLGQAYADPNSFQPTNMNALAQLVQGVQNGPMGFAPAGMTAWHGSPHTFDAFDSSKIGTGEGAQVYGHGLYLAETPAVAKQYADNVKDMGAIKNINAELGRLADTMAKEEIPGAYRKYRTDTGTQAAAAYDALMARRSSVSNAPGNLYEVDLPDHTVAKMLDWDKPINQQHPDVQSAVSKFNVDGAATGRDVYQALRERYAPGADIPGAPAWLRQQAGDVATRMRQAGIPGIRYLDGGSRGTGGTSNFVIFPGEENALSILARNGQPVR